MPTGCCAQGKTVKILTVGKKGNDSLKRLYGKYIVDAVDFRGAQGRAASAMRRRRRQDPRDVRRRRIRRLHAVLRRIQVGDLAEADGAAADPGDRSTAARPADLGGAVYEAEPEEGEILADLLPRNIAVQVFRGLLENAASEQGARMSAMDNATRNAGDMINKLSIKYNRQRQAQITKELIEIISGAEAL